MEKPDDLESLRHPREGIAHYLAEKIEQAADSIKYVLAFSMFMMIAPPLVLEDVDDDDGDIIFGLSSILYMLLDPLFFYVPLINEETKCLMLDNRLKIAALVLRALGDLRYVLRILIYIIIYRRAKRESPLGSVRCLKRIAMSTLSILPVPQVVILIFLPKMRGSRSSEIMKFLNSLILLQYLPRLYPIYRLCKQVNKKTLHKKLAHKQMSYLSTDVLDMLVSPKNKLKFAVAVNIYGYILASHVLGAFWYFFSIQREIGCWEYACRIENGCEFSTSCDGNTFRNITLFQNLCPISPPDATIFDFGIFLYALQSGMQASTNFPEKFLQSFLWGLRNLSSFASNLNTSTYVWENFFVVVISISGLMLFMYLLGHAQTIMQGSNKSDSIQRKMKIIEPQINSLISHYYERPQEGEKLKRRIKHVVKRNLAKDEDLIVENMFSILSIVENIGLASAIKRSLFLKKLKNVSFHMSIKREVTSTSLSLSLSHYLFFFLLLRTPYVGGLKGKDKKVLKRICKHLEPMIYTEGSFIIREGEPLDMMFFVTLGSVFIYPANNGDSSSSSVTIKLIEKEKDSLDGEEKREDSSHGEEEEEDSLHGEEEEQDSLPGEERGQDSSHGEEKGNDSLYGEELLTNWANRSSNEFSTLPISTVSVKSHKKVEIFAIKASDLHRVLYK